jgi:hypothetical protein
MDMTKYVVPRKLRAAIAVGIENTTNTVGIQIICERAGLPQPSIGGSNKLDRARKWLDGLDLLDDPIPALSDLVASVLEAAWSASSDEPDERCKAKEDLRRVLQECGLSYSNGRVVLAGGPPTETLEERLRTRRMSTVQEELERARTFLGSDPPAAITAACSLLEALFKTIIEDENLQMPGDKSIGPLWKVVRDHLGLAAESVPDDDLKKILGGLSAIVSGVGDLRTHTGSAHGRPRSSSAPQLRHARLAITAAHGLALFVVEVYEEATRAEGL